MPVTINGTTGIQDVLGSASAPSLSNTTASNTGLYFPTSTTLGLATNGTAAVTIDASQNVGIGTSSPNTKFVVSNGGAAGLEIQPTGFSSAPSIVSYNRSGAAYTQLTLDGASNVFAISGTERMRIDSSGNVGIGTASPSSRLHVSSAVSGYTTSLADSVTNATLLLKTNSGDSTLTSFGGLSSGAASIQRSNGPGTSSYDIALNPFGGAVMVGATAVIQSAKLLILANSTNNNAIVIQDTGTTYGTNQWFQVFANSSNAIAGTIAHTAVTTTAYQTSSDERLKENISDADVGLEKVNQIKVRAFDWKEDKSHTDYGFIAQELYKIFPEAVGRGSDGDEIENGKGTWQVEYGRLTPLLVKAVQELSAKVDAQAAEIAELKTKIG